MKIPSADPKKITFSLILLFLGIGLASLRGPTLMASANGYGLAFSTYLGGSGWDSARGVTTDASGNIYITGGTESPNFPITEGPAYQSNSQRCGSLGSLGKLDVFITKLSPSGKMVWSRLIDTPCYARAYAIHVDSSGFVYIAGRAGDHFPTTAGSIQPVFNGSKTNPSTAYGAQSGFIAKISADGSRIVWASYFGGNDQSFLRDMILDSGGYIFLAAAGVTAPNPFIAAGAFQTVLHGGTDLVAAKISNDGSKVLWASYFGGSGNDSGAPSVRVDSLDEPIFMDTTTSRDLLTTTGAFQRTLRGPNDVYVVKFSADGSRLVFSTYFGGSGEESTETHHLALDSKGNIFISFYVNSTDMPVTPNAHQKTLIGSTDIGLAKFSPTGQLLAATYLGGAGGEAPEGLATDSQGNLVVFGSSSSAGFGNCQTKGDAAIIRMKSDLSQLLSVNCFGGSTGASSARDGTVDSNDNLIAAGGTDSPDFPLLNPIQKNFGGVNDAIVLKLVSASLPTPTPTPTACLVVPSKPVLISPTNGSTVSLRQVPLDWTNANCGKRYEVMVRRGSTIGPIVDNRKNIFVSNYTTVLLTAGKTYYWRVRACDAKGCSGWSGYWRFKVISTG